MVYLGIESRTLQFLRNEKIKPNRKLVVYALVSCDCIVYDYEVDKIIKIFRLYVSKKRTDDENLAFSLCKAICKVKEYYHPDDFGAFLPWVKEGIEKYEHGKKHKKILRLVRHELRFI